MRVQFTKEELAIIERRRQGDQEGVIVPSDQQNKTITMAIEISDVHKFNMFLDKYLKDPNIKDQIGAKCVHVDFRKPIMTTELIAIQNYINDIIGLNKTNNDTSSDIDLSEEDTNDNDGYDYGEV